MKLVREAFLGLGPETLESAVYNLGKSNLIVIGDSQTYLSHLGIDAYLHKRLISIFDSTQLGSTHLRVRHSSHHMACGLCSRHTTVTTLQNTRKSNGKSNGLIHSRLLLL